MIKLRKFLCLSLVLLVLATVCSEAAGAVAAQKPDLQPPSAPTGLTVTNRTYTSISLSWTSSSDNVKVKGYYVYRDGKKIITTSKTTYTNSDLVPGRNYTYSIKAYDAAGNISEAGTAIIASPVPDSKAPSAPSNVSISSPGHTSIVVSWSPSTDNTGVKGYVVYRNGSRVAATTATSYTVKALLPGTAYSFFVKAYDAADNYSVQSGAITGVTLSDTEAPGKPNGLRGTAVTETQVTLMWSPSSDNVKVKGYEVYCNGEKKGTASKPIYTAKGLTPGTSYKYSVVALDTVGNRSASSDTCNITTLKDLKKPSAPTGLKAVKTKGSSVSLEWKASTDNTKVDSYIVYCNGMEIERSKRTARTVSNKSKLGIGIYWVKACDIAGNLSDASNVITVIIP